MKKATLITTRNISFTPLPLSFKEKEPQSFIKIPGEQEKTKVFEYSERPMSCKTCLEFGHTAKKFHEKIATCAGCSYEGHKKDKCTSNEVKCLHYGEVDQSYSRNCPVFKKEMKIVQIQTKERIPRQQAIRNLLGLKPHPELIYSHAVKNTSNRTTSKSPNGTDQNSQSESSEDDSQAVLSCSHGYYTK